MDSSFDLPVPDMFEVFEQSVHLPPWEMEYAPDQQMFENLELSIEQPVHPEYVVYDDEISRALDFIEEASTDKQQPSQRFFLPDVMLDKVEADTESQLIPPEASAFEP